MAESTLIQSLQTQMQAELHIFYTPSAWLGVDLRNSSSHHNLPIYLGELSPTIITQKHTQQLPKHCYFIITGAKNFARTQLRVRTPKQGQLFTHILHIKRQTQEASGQSWRTSDVRRGG